MSKCHVRELVCLYRALFKDARYRFPTLGTEFERDLNRLLRLAQQRGLPVFLTDLPAAGKHLDRCLADGLYKLSGLPLTKRYSNRTPIPKFLRGLYLQVFDESGTLKEDCDVEAVFFLRQILFAAKKTSAECPSSKVSDEVRNFLAHDRCLPEPGRYWAGSHQHHPGADLNDARCEGEIRGSIDQRSSSIEHDEVAALNSSETHECETTRPLQPSSSELSECDIRPRRPGLRSPGSRRGSEYHDSPRETDEGGVTDETFTGFQKSPVYVCRLGSRSARERAELTTLLGKLDIVSGLLISALGSYDPSEWRFRHGPGAISEKVGPTNKYCWINWSASLESEFPIADYGFHSYSSWAYESDRLALLDSQEPSSRMVAVPKTFTKPRLIAAEPCSNQWCQQNLWHYFRERTHASWIYRFVHFDDQTRNQRMCLAGSRTGRTATVDLSAASDSVTCHAVGQFFRSNPKVLRSLRACRTRLLRQALAYDEPGLVELRKFSTMGNACTFPVETLIFLAIALASVLTTRKLRPSLREVKRLSREVAVFGDDVIVPVDSRALFTASLEVLDFKINDSKTFWNGQFRESCGVDAFRGYDVTPAYWKGAYDGTPESLASAIECSNNFYQKFLLNTSSYIASTLPKGIPQVAMSSGVTGFKTRTAPSNPGFNTRVNKGLQRSEIWVRAFSTSQPKTSTNDDTALLQYFTENPDPFSKWKHGVAQRPKLRNKFKWVALEQVVS